MNREFDFGGRNFRINNSQIHVDDFILVPGEVDSITALLSMAGSMSKLKALPPEIGDGTFVIRFNPEGHHGLIREHDESRLDFRFENVNDLIVYLQDALAVAVDMQKTNPVKAPQYSGEQHGDIFEGRN